MSTQRKRSPTPSVMAHAVAMIITACAITACGGSSDTTSNPAQQTAVTTDPPGSVRLNDVLYLPLADGWTSPPLNPAPIAELTLDELAENLRPMLGVVDSET